MAEDSPGAGLSLESPVAPTAPWARPLTQPQNKFALGIIRSLKKMKDAVPFLYPVDPIALNIPQYSTIITNPMDLSTVEKKLGGAKVDGGQYQRYANVEEFVTDFKLIIQNCVTFNGPEHPVSQMVKRVDEAFDKQMKNMPTADDVSGFLSLGSLNANYLRTGQTTGYEASCSKERGTCTETINCWRVVPSSRRCLRRGPS